MTPQTKTFQAYSLSYSQMTLNQAKYPTFNCFIAHDLTLQYGKLELLEDDLHFKYVFCDNKHEYFKYDTITKIEIDKKLRNQIQILGIIIGKEKYRFLGLHEIDYITSEIRKHQKNSEPETIPSSKSVEILDKAKQPTTRCFELMNCPMIDLGPESKSVEIIPVMTSPQIEFKPLLNPISLYSCTIPQQLDSVISKYLNNTAILRILNESGNRNVVISQWTENNGYNERTISYQKCVDLLILGKQYVNVVEIQQYFDLGDVKAISITTSLEHSLYSNCFDPYVQLTFRGEGQNVQFSVQFEMKWKKDMLIKNVIQSKTEEETKLFYTQLTDELFSETEPEKEFESIQIENDCSQIAQKETLLLQPRNNETKSCDQSEFDWQNEYDHKREAAFFSLMFFVYLMKSSKSDTGNSCKSPIFISKLLIILLFQYVLFSILL